MAAINVFISSSFHSSFTLGFNGEREALKAEFAKDKDLNDISLDYGDPQIQGSVDTSLERVEESELVILFIGTRYGGIVDQENVSLTHLEYRKAVELGKSLLVYVFPRDIEHSDYDHVSEFIGEVEKDNKTTHTDIEGLFPKYKYDVLACKAGAIEENEQIKEKQVLFYDALASKIIGDIANRKDSLKFTLPFGVKELKDDKNEKSRYKQNLSNETLPYVSRSQFKNEYDLGKYFLSEIDLFEKVFGDHLEYDGILISGEGGVGKTRLMFELGRKAQSEGWRTYQVFTDFKGWDTLKLDSTKKYCFLFDYIEESSYFDKEIIKVLKREYPEVKIKIVSNARNTYFIHNDVDSTDLYRVNLSENDKSEKLYLQYVIENIFQYKNIDINKFGMNIEEIVNKPSFAVFLLEGILRNKKVDLHGVKGFSDYIEKRLALTFQTKFVEIEKDVFRLFSSLPIKGTQLNETMDESIVDLLDHDGWLEYDAEDDLFSSPYNDTIVDEILISYLYRQEFSLDRKLKTEVYCIFNYSKKFNTVNNVLWSMIRIFYKSILKKKVKLLQSDIQIILCETAILRIDTITNIVNLFDLDKKEIASKRLSHGIKFLSQYWALKTLGSNSLEAQVFARIYLKSDSENFNEQTTQLSLKILGSSSPEVKIFMEKYLSLDIRELNMNITIQSLNLLGKQSSQAKAFAVRYLKSDIWDLNTQITIFSLKILSEHSSSSKEFSERYLKSEIQNLNMRITTHILDILGKKSLEAKAFAVRYLEVSIWDLDVELTIHAIEILGLHSSEVKIFAKKYLDLDMCDLNGNILSYSFKALESKPTEKKALAKQYLQSNIENINPYMSIWSIKTLGEYSYEVKAFSERYLKSEIQNLNMQITTHVLKILGKKSLEVRAFSERYLKSEIQNLNMHITTRILKILGEDSSEVRAFAVQYLKSDMQKLDSHITTRILKILGEHSSEARAFAVQYLKSDILNFKMHVTMQSLKILGEDSSEAKAFAVRYLKSDIWDLNTQITIFSLKILSEHSSSSKEFSERYLKLDLHGLDSHLTIRTLNILGEDSSEAKAFAVRYLESDIHGLDSHLIIRTLNILGEDSSEANAFSERYLKLDIRNLDELITVQSLKLLGEHSSEAKEFASQYLRSNRRDLNVKIIMQSLNILGKESSEVKKFVMHILNR